MVYALYRTLGEARFDGVTGDYFRAYRSTGSDTDEFVRYVSEPPLAIPKNHSLHHPFLSIVH